MPGASLRTRSLARKAQALLATFPGTALSAAGWQYETGRRLANRSMPAKGKTIGGAAVHRQQALVLINQIRQPAKMWLKLAHYVRQQVGEKFNVWLQPEVRFIGETGEVNAEETIA
jgi:UDP-N-acetylmuramate dehydrogenase